MRCNLTESQRERLVASYLANGFRATASLAKSYGVQPKYLSKLARIAGPQRNYKDKGPTRSACASNKRQTLASGDREFGLVRKKWNQREISLARALLNRCASEQEIFETLGCTKNSAKKRLARVCAASRSVSFALVEGIPA